MTYIDQIFFENAILKIRKANYSIAKTIRRKIVIFELGFHTLYLCTYLENTAIAY